MKICTKCHIEQDESEFNKNSSSKNGLHSKCKSCFKFYRHQNKEKIKKQMNEYGKNNKRKIKENHLKLKFNISLEEYKKLFQEQNGVCAICKKVETSFDYRTKLIKDLAVDHDHKTGKIRGLLCGACNRALGLFKDNPEILIEASEYLKENKIVIEAV